MEIDEESAATIVALPIVKKKKKEKDLHTGPNLENYGSIWYWPKGAISWKKKKKAHHNFYHPQFNPFSNWFTSKLSFTQFSQKSIVSNWQKQKGLD